MQQTAAIQPTLNKKAIRQEKPAKRVPSHVSNQLIAFGNGSLPDSARLPILAVSILTGRSRNSIYRDIAAGRLHPVKIGTGVFFAVSDVRAYLAGGAA